MIYTAIYTSAFQKLYTVHFLHKYSHTHFSIYDNVHFKTYHIFVHNLLFGCKMKEKCYIVSLEIMYDHRNPS